MYGGYNIPKLVGGALPPRLLLGRWFAIGRRAEPASADSGFAECVLVPLDGACRGDLRLRRPPANSHCSHRAASAIFSLPFPSRPFIHSSAAAGPRALTSPNLDFNASTWDLRKCLVRTMPTGG